MAPESRAIFISKRTGSPPTERIGWLPRASLIQKVSTFKRDCGQFLRGWIADPTDGVVRLKRMLACQDDPENVFQDFLNILQRRDA